MVTLGDVLFDTGKATLKPGAYRDDRSSRRSVEQGSESQVIIEGHTDSVGSDEIQPGLSERRAGAVQAALLERGVTQIRSGAVGKGESTPVASNDDAGGRQQNRRVEMIFADEQSRTATDVD